MMTNEQWNMVLQNPACVLFLFFGLLITLAGVVGVLTYVVNKIAERF